MDAPPSTRMILQVLNPSFSNGTSLWLLNTKMLPSKADRSSLRKWILESNKGVAGLEGRRSPCVFFGGVSLKAEKNYRLGKKKHVCPFFWGGMIWKKSFFAFDCTNAGVWDLCRVSYMLNVGKCLDSRTPRNCLKQKWGACIIPKKKQKFLEMMASSISKSFPLFGNV